MNKIQIKKLNNKLDELENFINNKPSAKLGVIVEKIRKLARVRVEDKRFEESEIIGWIAKSSSLFSEVGVNKEIINHFLSFLKFNTKKASDGLEKSIGPFVAVGWRNKTYNLSNIVNADYIKIAFQCARVNLNKMIDDERIVSAWLLEELSLNDETKNIFSSLELVENCYQKKDKNGMIINVSNVLDSILNLDRDLKNKGKNNISKKLNLLLNSEDKLNKLGVDKDVVLALNGFRIIRNKKVAHNGLPLKYDIPFLVAVSYVYLVIFFIEVFILNGEVFRKKA